MNVVGPDSHVTLHYRLAVRADAGEREIISTFGGSPATVQIGAGCLVEPLEKRLLGLVEGQEATFDLATGEAFGERRAELVQSLQRASFDRNADPREDYAPGDVVEFNGPDGGRVAGVLKLRDEQTVVVDFNHPLAGQALRFSVRVVGVI